MKQSRPKNYNKKEFIDFLKKNNTDIDIVKRFENLPETIKYNDSDYVMNIIITWHSNHGSYYNFEINYYSEEIIEYLLNYKIFKDIEITLNYLECQLTDKNLIEITENC